MIDILNSDEDANVTIKQNIVYNVLLANVIVM